VKKVPARTPWTPEEEAELIRLRAKSLSWRAVGYAMGRARDMCRERFLSLVASGAVAAEVSSKTWSRVDVDRLVAMRTEGQSWPKIALALGRTSMSARMCWTRVKAKALQP